MPVFINYSHKDKEFANKLALNLIGKKAFVWMDEWEISAGESLIEKIQQGIAGATVMIAIFSKASLESIWCKREVNAGIQRELEEKRVVVVPVLLEDCTIPLFLRDKRFADFRSNFDEGLGVVFESIAKFTNASLGRCDEGADYLTDWSKDSGYIQGRFFLEFALLQHSEKLPYSVFTQIWIIGSEEATQRFNAYSEAGFVEFGELAIVESVVSVIDGYEFVVLLEDAKKKEKVITIQDPATGLSYVLRMESRRLGTDTGRDILMHGADEIRKIRNTIAEIVRQPTEEETRRLGAVINRNTRRTSRK